jgi:hypothetical protein
MNKYLYEDCIEMNPIALADEQITCKTCGLPPLDEGEADEDT